MPRRLTILVTTAALLVPGAAACAAVETETSVGTLSSARSLDTVGPVDTVVVVSIDGLNPRAITKLRRKRAPALNKLIRTGATTLNARTEHELTDTLPNHVGMVTGRRIEAATGGHGVTWNDERRRPATVRAAAGEPVSSVFNVVRQAGGSAATFASKRKFSLWERSWPTAISTDVIVEDNRALVTRFIDDLGSEQRSLRFLHLSGPDAAGHHHGFMRPAYLRSVAAADRQLRRVLRGIAASPRLRGHTAVVLTSDHGGLGRNHRDPGRRANYTVPFMVWGPGVARGADLYELNPTYSNPKRTRTTYADAPIRNGAVANLALDLLGLPAVPGSEHNAEQDLEWSPLSARQGQ